MGFYQFVMKGYAEARSKLKPGNTNILEDTKNTRSGKQFAIPEIDQLFLVLCRLRVGLLETDLAYRYGVSCSTISRVFTFWVDFLENTLSQVPIWPTKEIVLKYMPQSFREYPNTRIILDATEFFIENPSDFRVQCDTYSTYKSHNTAKGLIGITPNGFISFVSDLAPGRISDKEITLYSGLLQKLERGDTVMADRGFLIKEMLEEIGVSLNIPPFLDGADQLNLEKEILTRNIASVRIHVERVIRRVKSFRLLKFVIPNSMHHKLDKIWKISCYLVNFIGDPLLDKAP